MPVADRSGKTVDLKDLHANVLRRLYTTAAGRGVLKLLTTPGLSRLTGRFLDSHVSRKLIARFVRRNGIDLADYEQRPFDSFNDFFCRRILDGKRPVDPDENALIAPADSKLTVLPVTDAGTFRIKNILYTFWQLVRDEALAAQFRGGTILIFRLTVSDYHRYCWPCTGTASEEKHLAGILHTVNPVAAESRPIYAENTREYTLIETERFGTVLMMEVGAMLVGRIVNDRPGNALRGAEKGHFEYGGSTVILVLEKGRTDIDPALVENTKNGYETAVKMGERIAVTTKSK